MKYEDRAHAGQELADRLTAWVAEAGLTDIIVLALPRGGVPVAAAVARALGAPLDILVARKIGAPGQPEYGIGAMAGDDAPVFDQDALTALGLTEERLSVDVVRERTELRRREDLYRGGHPAADLRDRTVVLIDDGLATGITARAALRHLRRQHPARLVLAVPVGSRRAVDRLQSEADVVVCLYQPPYFHAVGQWYADFEQLSDRDVLRLLDEFSGGRHGR
ncbi:phosphoribosyltransferase family protein [Streptomyces sannanensis]|uniref:Phosphoribosyltransferase family protein n=1 Tax=Streptomyces sannanensis TaxID=285536 RepID=A0ABP6S3P5_9ACTN